MRRTPALIVSIILAHDTLVYNCCIFAEKSLLTQHAAGTAWSDRLPKTLMGVVECVLPQR